jgi:hypothetical protein
MGGWADGQQSRRAEEQKSRRGEQENMSAQARGLEKPTSFVVDDDDFCHPMCGDNQEQRGQRIRILSTVSYFAD